MRYITCGAFENPKRAKSYARFSSAPLPIDEAQAKAIEWENEKRYKFIWIEEVK